VDAAGGARLVAWTGRLSQLRATFRQLLTELPEHVEVLLKISVERRRWAGQSHAREAWTRYYGTASKHKLEAAIATSDAFVFSDSRNQLCVRDPQTSEYVVIDDNGVVYVYSASERFRRVFQESGFEERVERLVGDEAHWDVVPPDGEGQERQFVSLLGLVRVDANDHSSPG
jgi:hypothetical protein